MKLVPLTQGQFAKVDDEDFDFLNQFKWCAKWDKTAQSFYAHRGLKKTTIRMHRLIMKTPVNLVCDHINRDTLDNQKANLRNITSAQNRTNSKTYTNNKLGLAGIHTQPTIKGYRVRLAFAGKRVFDKIFKSIEDARIARLEAEKKYFGEFRKK